jgi:hypothetical protein
MLLVRLIDARLNVFLITAKRRTLSPLAEIFIQCAREAVKPPC